MSCKQYILAIDQGSSTKSLIFDVGGIVVAKGSEPNPKLLPDPGSFNFTHHKLMPGVYSHFVVIVVDYIASLFFPKPELQENLLFTSWKKNRNYENA